ncbi:hypothetical protein D0T25_23605 [Duganella sp. BJB488]|uniref:hypothetical protein n=1 Tax=unclassified Duganella TaxID=2636909 RepID=UPI000EDCFF4B|nr:MULTISPECIES: hypothetical protein [unclassified Duganella]RFP13154.1 hypothetical protein D0T26_22950 [Duganella sp. BJB489]RFP17083.1 hypothetical protein D0T25_23605 [Duganella sp. BJB488]
MATTARIQHYRTEYQMVVRAMKLLMETVEVSERQGRTSNEQLLELSADLVSVFASLSERLLAQVRRRELEIDLVLAALIREGCDCMANVTARITRGDPRAHLVASQSRVMDGHAALIFERSCVRALAGNAA